MEDFYKLEAINFSRHTTPQPFGAVVSCRRQMPFIPDLSFCAAYLVFNLIMPTEASNNMSNSRPALSIVGMPIAGIALDSL